MGKGTLGSAEGVRDEWGTWTFEFHFRLLSHKNAQARTGVRLAEPTTRDRV